MTSELKVLQQQFPRVQACWAAIVLYGQHSATYKFALARCLLELAQRGQKRVSLEELAVPYAWYLCIHTARAPRQFTSRSSTVFRSCEEFNAGKINQEALLQVVVQYGFNNVLDAFHIVNGEAVPVRFFEKRFVGSSKGIVLTEALFQLVRQGNVQQLLLEVEQRWGEVEAAWARGK
ncbi:hypothetical protein LQE88_07285 [Acidaminococcus sp. NSJ-142]|jgi:hypothetical protein|uniref:hypothetical protein n=1 Tax=Acidaminococcus TaxID=904 RepID=UPI000CFA7819|nr:MULTISPECIES: hypothetical protein [Acidaminococcus]MCD2435789.1 hypothetical protein [Acidaminococcus hominis]MCH4097501.1 hypothetical protein [Acidaminococcus provencensis]RHJ99979.1 hypothetical protein DW089_09550 [Acidaminococcus sp. AM05-11]